MCYMPCPYSGVVRGLAENVCGIKEFCDVRKADGMNPVPTAQPI
jgi:hypothetical protein